MLTLLDNWIGWLGLGATLSTVAALLAGLSWIPGAGVLLSIGTALLQIAAPLINGFLTLIIWLWSNILFPGLRNILSSLSSIITVVLMGCFLWFGLITRYEIKLAQKNYVVSKCSNPVSEPETDFTLPWPFNWK